MKPISSLQCPYCEHPAQVTSLSCSPCGIEIKGPFSPNEFARLGQEDLHFLRIFLQFEGRIRDMEAPLGLSYPTIRSRLSALKEKILTGPAATTPPPASPLGAALDSLESGARSFEETLQQIKKIKGGKK